MENHAPQDSSQDAVNVASTSTPSTIISSSQRDSVASTASGVGAAARQHAQTQFAWIDVDPDLDLTLSPPQPSVHPSRPISTQSQQNWRASSGSTASAASSSSPPDVAGYPAGTAARASVASSTVSTVVPAQDSTTTIMDANELPRSSSSSSLQGFAPRGSSLGFSQQGDRDRGGARQVPIPPPLASLIDPPDSPTFYRNASAEQSASYPSPPSPAFRPTYDTPHSPGLPSSPYLGGAFPSSQAQSAALVPLPTSPYHDNQSFQLSQRGSSLPSPNMAYDPIPRAASPLYGPDRGSYFADTASYSDASSTRRLMYNSGTPSPGLAINGARSPVPPYRDSYSSTPPDAALNAGYFDTSNGHKPRVASLANESSIWGGDDSDEKGFYGALDRGMGMEETKRAAGGLSSSASKWKNAAYNSKKSRPWSTRKKIVVGAGALALGLIAVIAAVIAVKKVSNSDSVRGGSAQSSADDSSNASNGGGSNTGSNSGNKPKPGAPTTGTDGSTVTMDGGKTFIYKNQFGGHWVSTPFDNSAKAQSYSPALNEDWDYSSDKILGVNIGGWLTLEPFIAPAMFEPFLNAPTPAVDEWSLSVNLGTNLESALRQHYDTFITEEDFAQIAGAGLNWIRLSIPFWAIETQEGEPYLEGVAWTYFLKAITWARKYGLRINLDLHAIPGSQNGWNHSGRLGTVNFLNGVMGLANAQRTLNYIRVITEFISQPDIQPVVPMFGIMNEAWTQAISLPVLRAFYLEVYNVVREITGTGTNKGPIISYHDGFQGSLNPWAGFLQGADRIALDSHPYLAFTNTNSEPMSMQIPKPCDQWAAGFNTSMSAFGLTVSGEWSLGVNDCGQFLNGVNNGTRFEGTYKDGSPNEDVIYGNCDDFTDISTFNDTFKTQMMEFALTNMDAFQNWFFWTWNIGESTVLNRVASPQWCYKCGLEYGYMPTDPRAQHVGACIAMAEKYNGPAPPSAPYDGSLSPWMTGGAGAGNIAPTQLASYSRWPPASLNNAPSAGSLNVANLYSLTPTGAALTLTASPTLPNTAYRTPIVSDPYYTKIAGCDYPNAWLGAGQPAPTAPPC